MSTPILIARVDSPGHHDPTHPENPERFAHFDRLTLALADSLKLVATSPAKIEEVGRVHTPAMLSFLQQACQKAGRLPLIIDPAPTFAAKGSWQAALQAAGAVLELVRAVMAGSAQQAFALVRPPGHHAEPAQSKGFCLINNLAVGVAEALAQGVERVAVVDFDAHHGNGTQAIFWKEPRVGFFSSHQEHIYPGSGALEEAPHARGRIINLPLPAGAGDLAFEQMADQVIEPWLAQVSPRSCLFQPVLTLTGLTHSPHWASRRKVTSGLRSAWPSRPTGTARAGWFGSWKAVMIRRPWRIMSRPSCKLWPV
jgi:acetoin utilization deacetylase AcuC-like enzyme